MTMISIVQTASRDAYPALIAGLETQYGSEGSIAIACAFLEAEYADFHWESRIEERHLGRYESLDGGEEELERIAIIGQLRGAWFVATCIVDGDGAVHFMHDLRLFTTAGQADEMFCQTR